MNTTLHVPLNKELKFKAEYIAKKKGYSSLQEVLRVFIVQFTNEEVKPVFINTEKTIYLTSHQEDFLQQRVTDTQQAENKNETYSIGNAEEMMKILEE